MRLGDMGYNGDMKIELELISYHYEDVYSLALFLCEKKSPRAVFSITCAETPANYSKIVPFKAFNESIHL
ncbi:MAG: hypothetical protein ACTSRA_04560 [Promethearchaeota archaeon]